MMRPIDVHPDDTSTSDDLILGATAIARFLGMTRKQVYAHVERRNLPCFRIGSTVCLRKSTFFAWTADQELANVELSTLGLNSTSVGDSA